MRAILFFSLILFFSSILLASTLSASAAETGVRNETIVGGWTPIKNLSDPHVQEIANFAVEEHNKEGGPPLKLTRVLRGETQVVSGINYRLAIEATDVGGRFGNYEAVVWEKSWEHFRKLTSFKPLLKT
ncbi:hypothetical protein HPP92_024150 [Vanilla planifolia]|uniref:Cystatin domain-containing protein n=1 Tax=Vanilla planifolia TaxID=51239 RepID=A0A835PN09_VANPL|nr:hypothetical protein HPP92_024483 [Vanilla planifolia]KAG0456362.1 hypothetical protein HPP92_024150 [Vanilla planifolia]